MIEPQKAMIVSLETKHEFKFSYNPSAFSLKRNSGVSGQQGQGPWGGIKWQCPNPDELSMDFILDVSEAKELLQTAALLLPISSLASLAGMLDTSSVLKELGNLYSMTIPHLIEGGDASAMRPPYVAFLWGDFQFFGAIQNIDSKMVLFDVGGIPKRAEVSITMIGQAMNPPGKSEELSGKYDPAYKWPKLKTFSGSASSLKSTDLRISLLGGSMSTFKAT